MKKVFRMGEIYRYAKDTDFTPEIVDNLPNYYHIVGLPLMPLPLLAKGVNPIGKNAKHTTTPAVLISSSPHKIGSSDTPWQDYFDPDNGHIKYYGDNKIPGKNPNLAPGNKKLLEIFNQHSSFDENTRKQSIHNIF